MNYIVFYGSKYYPLGGAKDEHRAFSLLVEARAFADGVTQESLTWAHVYNLDTDTIEYEVKS